jgi:hypothetical protein
VEPDIVQRYEGMLQALRCNRADDGGHDFDPASEAAFDTAALAAALGPALMLSGGNETPTVARILEQCGVPCCRLEPDAEDSLARCERELVREMAVHAGLAPLRAAGVKLAVVHLLVPEAAGLRTRVDAALSGDDGGLPLEFTPPQHDEEALPASPLWSGARLYWYWL